MGHKGGGGVGSVPWGEWGEGDSVPWGEGGGGIGSIPWGEWGDRFSAMGRMGG